MGLFDELKKLTRPYSSDEYDEFGDEYADPSMEQRAPAPEPPRKYAPPPAERHNPFSDYEAPPRPAPAPAPARRDKVVSLGNPQAQVVLVKPDRFEMAAEIADHIRERRSVVLNLEGAQTDVARRLVDFLSGVAYALDGTIRRVAANTYIIAPNNVDIMGDRMGEIDTGGIYMQ